MEKLNKILENHVAIGEDTKDKVLGVAFIVVNKDGVLYQGSAGRVDLPVDSPRFTVDSFGWFASMTKLITATALMQLVDRGKISLDDDVRPLVPELSKFQILRGFDESDKPILEENTNAISLRHLLVHTLGLGYDLADPQLMKWSKAVGRVNTCNTLTLEGWTTPLKFAPGEGWYYGPAPDWAGRALVALTGASLAEYMVENLFKPLGMDDTTFYPLRREDKPSHPRMACSYRDGETGTLSVGPPPVAEDPPIESGGAGLWMTCADYAKVLQALLLAGSEPGGSSGEVPAPPRILRKEAVDEMFRPQLDDQQRGMLKFITDMFRETMVSEFQEGLPLDHGISGVINLEDSPGKRRAGSMMWLGMANSHWWIDRKAGIAAALVVNVEPVFNGSVETMPKPEYVVNKLYDELERAVYSSLIGPAAN